MTARVEIYTREYCGYCTRAKALLASKGVDFIEYRAEDEPCRRREMIQRSQGMTYPQILINDRPIGGCDEMHDLDYDGRLDPMLAETASAQEGPAPAQEGLPS